MQIKRQDLLDQLDQVKPGLHNGTDTPQSDAFLFKDGKVFSYNDEVMIQHPCLLELEGVVKAAPLYQLLTKLVDEELNCELGEGELLLTGKRSHASLVLEAEITSPAKDVKLPTKWNPLPAGLIDGMLFCLFSASSDMSKPALTNIHSAGTLVESCDNFRLTRYQLAGKLTDPLLIPATAVALIKQFKGLTQYGIVPGWVHFADKAGIKGTVFSCRTSSEKYPDLTKLTDVEGFEVEIPKGLKGALDRAEVFTETEFNQDRRVEITFKEGTLTLVGRNAYGWYREKMPLKYKGEPRTFQTHPGLLMEMLGMLDRVTIGERQLKMEGKNFEHVVSIMTPTAETEE